MYVCPRPGVELGRCETGSCELEIMRLAVVPGRKGLGDMAILGGRRRKEGLRSSPKLRKWCVKLEKAVILTAALAPVNRHY